MFVVYASKSHPCATSGDINANVLDNGPGMIAGQQSPQVPEVGIAKWHITPITPMALW
jgi:hypothetical protein